MEENPAVRAESIGKIVRPCETIVTVVETKTDIVAITAAVGPVIYQAESQVFFLIKRCKYGKIVNAIGVIAVDTQQNCRRFL